MNPVFKKLNYKAQPEIIILNPPSSFQAALDEMLQFTKVSSTTKTGKKFDFLLAFATTQKQVDDLAKIIHEKSNEDAVVWIAYPKGTSKRYKCEFNRDNGWNVLGYLGYEGVRMVAIDEDWSALRFRRARHIKTMIRSFAMSDEGKKKVASKKSGTKS